MLRVHDAMRCLGDRMGRQVGGHRQVRDMMGRQFRDMMGRQVEGHDGQVVLRGP